MKDILFYVGFAAVILLGIGSIVYGMRMFSNVTTPITLHEVKPGITCATMVTSDGAAIDCWKE